MNLLTYDYSPFLCAFTILILLGIAELISLLLGWYLSGALDAHFEHIHISTHESPAIQFLDYLNVGRIPLMVVLCLVLGCFGLIGVCSQYCLITFFGSPLSPFLVSIFSLILTCPLVHTLGIKLAPWLPHDESSAVSEDSFIGCLAFVTGSHAIAGKPCEARLKDKFGQIHYLLVEPEEGTQLHSGNRIIIIERLTSTRYLAEKNPWPDILI